MVGNLWTLMLLSWSCLIALHKLLWIPELYAWHLSMLCKTVMIQLFIPGNKRFLVFYSNFSQALFSLLSLPLLLFNLFISLSIGWTTLLCESLKSEVWSRKSEVGSLKSEVRSPKSEVGSLKSEVGSLKSEVRSRKSEVGSPKSEVWSLKSEVRSRKSEVGSLKSEVRSRKSEVGNPFLGHRTSVVFIILPSSLAVQFISFLVDSLNYLVVRKSEVWSLKSEVRSRKSEVGSPFSATVEYKLIKILLNWNRIWELWKVYSVPKNVYHLRRFSFLLVSRCPAGIDRGCLVISGFGRHLGLCDTISLDVMLVSIRCQQDELRLSQAALSCISKVRGYDHVCSRWSAKTTCKYHL